MPQARRLPSPNCMVFGLNRINPVILRGALRGLAKTLRPNPQGLECPMHPPQLCLLPPLALLVPNKLLPLPGCSSPSVTDLECALSHLKQAYKVKLAEVAGKSKLETRGPGLLLSKCAQVYGTGR